MIKGPLVNFKGRFRGGGKLAETPFIRIGNKWNRFRLYDFESNIGGGWIDFDFTMRDQQTGVDQVFIKAGAVKPVVIFLISEIYLAIQLPVAGKNKSAGVAERSIMTEISQFYPRTCRWWFCLC